LLTVNAKAEKFTILKRYLILDKKDDLNVGMDVVVVSFRYLHSFLISLMELIRLFALSFVMTLKELCCL